MTWPQDPDLGPDEYTSEDEDSTSDEKEGPAARQDARGASSAGGAAGGAAYRRGAAGPPHAAAASDTDSDGSISDAPVDSISDINSNADDDNFPSTDAEDKSDDARK